MLSVLAIVVSLLLLMFFAYRGYSVLLLAPLMARWRWCFPAKAGGCCLFTPKPL